jgi:NTP pyrophosphatase (non-canonical NTP hydrolase)
MMMHPDVKKFEDIYEQPLENLVSYVAKEAGEMIDSVFIEKDDRWIQELGDLCGVVIPALLKKANITYEEVQEIGRKRFEEELNRRRVVRRKVEIEERIVKADRDIG